MSYAHVVWDALPWQQGNHPLEHKKLAPQGTCVLLMFMPGFADPNLCTRSHVLQVLEGTLSLGLGEETLRVGPGELVLLEPNTPHRAANEGSEPVVLLAVSDLPLAL